MKLANIEWNGATRVALIAGDEAIDLTRHLSVTLDDVPEFLGMGPAAIALAQRALRASTPRIPLNSVRVQAPVRRADKIIGVGMNYHSFVRAARDIGIPVPPDKIWFLRPRGCIVGPFDDIWLPRHSIDLDYEAELAIVIGRKCRHVSPAEAPSVIAGYTIANDLTLRERARTSIVLGKSCDTHTPLGPWIVTEDEIGDPHKLDVKTWVNGTLRQQSNTSDMIALCHELVAEISSACILNPGDILLTGTPDGCGVFHVPPLGLVVGDVVRIEIGKIGVIQNRVVDEPAVA